MGNPSDNLLIHSGVSVTARVWSDYSNTDPTTGVFHPPHSLFLLSVIAHLAFLVLCQLDFASFFNWILSPGAL